MQTISTVQMESASPVCGPVMDLMTVEIILMKIGTTAVSILLSILFDFVNNTSNKDYQLGFDVPFVYLSIYF